MNDRVLFDGPAGSGKTVLACEAARREALGGKRTLFLCFNRALAHDVARELSGVAKLEVSSLHSKLLAVTGAAPGDGERFWQDELPARAVDALLGVSEPYDALIVDELQDLLHKEYFDCLDLLVRDGLRSGRWRMFGDVLRQRLYRRSPPAEFLAHELGAGPVRFQLTVNCRNTPRIASLAGRVAGVPECYARVRRPDDGHDPRIVVYSTEADQEGLLVEELARLQDDGFRGDAVAVLSSRARGTSESLRTPWSDRIGPIDPPMRGRMRAGTIHSFKGLEAPAVVLTDINSLRTQADRDLFYVGCTRARHRLVVIASSDVIPTLRDIVLGGDN